MMPRTPKVTLLVNELSEVDHWYWRENPTTEVAEYMEANSLLTFLQVRFLVRSVWKGICNPGKLDDHKARGCLRWEDLHRLTQIACLQ